MTPRRTPPTTPRIIVAEACASRCTALSQVVRDAGFEPISVASAEEAQGALTLQPVLALLLDASVWESEQWTWLRESASRVHDAAVIAIVTHDADDDSHQRLLNDGATDVLLWPARAMYVRLRVRDAIEKTRLVRESASLRATIDERVLAGSRKYEALFLASLQTLADALEVKDSYTWGHSIRVSEYAMAIARELDLPADLLKQIEFGSRLHDIGKIGVREAVLNKKGALTEEEYAHVMAHPVIGWKLLEPLLRDMPHALAVVRWHHERMDGRGVPDRLCGAQIPIEARITAVADSFDAMTSGRPYQPGVSVEDALAELWRCSGTQFCTECVAAFERVLEHGTFSRPDWPVQRPLRAVRIVA